MTLRHAAALAVIGWYLMMPPPYWSKTNPRNAPLRQWTVFGRYDRAQECSDERTKMIRVQSMALLSDLAEGVSDALGQVQVAVINAEMAILLATVAEL